ncbi:MAG: CPBP family intramembrane glutamic endopeptidase [Bacteroidaceae bacterium]|jgi:membrane protease YdiL (CAAX protease family)
MLYQGMYEQRSRRCQAGVLLLLIVAGFFLSLFPLLMLQIVAPDPTLAPVARASVVIQDVCLFILPPAMGVLLLFRQPALQVLSIRRPRIDLLLCAIAVIGLLNPLIDLTAQWNMNLKLPQLLQGLEQWLTEMEQSANLLIESMLHDERISVLLLNILIIAILAGISEELLFRGLLMKLIYRWLFPKASAETTKSVSTFPQDPLRFHAAVWITAFLFSAIHLQFYGFLPRLLLGAALGYICAYGGLWAAILAHSANNTLAILVYPNQPYNSNWQWVNVLSETGDETVSLPLVILCTALTIGILWYMSYRYARLAHR